MCGRHADLHVGNGLEGRFIQTLINASDCSFVDERMVSSLAPEHSFSDDETFGYRAMSIEGHGERAVDFVAWALSLGADGIWRRRGVRAFGDAAEQNGRRPLRCAFPG